MVELSWHAERLRPWASVGGLTSTVPDVTEVRAPSGRGLPLSVWTAGAIAGVAVAAVYVLSPMTVWCGVGLAGLFTLAGRGLTRVERRWVLAMLACALALRIIAVLGLFSFANHDESYFTSFFFDGDGRALKLRSMWITNFWSGRRVDPFEASYALNFGYGWSSYLYVLAYLQYLIGPAPYGIHLLNIGLFLTAAVILHHVARQAYGPLAAFIGLAFLLFSPTLFLWSVSAMKEPLHFVLTAVLLLCTVHAVRASTWQGRLVALAGVAAALISIETVREGTLAAGLVGIGLGLLMTFTIRRPYLLILVLVTGAVVGVGLGRRADVQDQVRQGVRWAAGQHLARYSKGYGYELLDDRFYAPDHPVVQRVGSMTWGDAARFVARGAAAFVVVPLPWQVASWPRITFLPAQLFWYGLFLLAVVGLSTALRRDTLVTALLVSSAAVVAAAISITEGNIGTLVRHRDLVVPLLVWISAIGAVRLLAWLAMRAPRPLGLDVDARIDRERRDDDAAVRLVTDVFRRRAEAAAALTTTMWREARFAGIVAHVRRRMIALEDWQCVRLAGWILLVALMVESMLVSPGESFEKAITVIVRGGLAALALLLIVGGHAVARAWWNHAHH